MKKTQDTEMKETGWRVERSERKRKRHPPPFELDLGPKGPLYLDREIRRTNTEIGIDKLHKLVHIPTLPDE